MGWKKRAIVLLLAGGTVSAMLPGALAADELANGTEAAAVVEAEDMEIAAEATAVEAEETQAVVIDGETEAAAEKTDEAAEETEAAAAQADAHKLATSGKCGANLTWKLDGNGTLTISGSGAMYDYTYFQGDAGTNYRYSPWGDNPSSSQASARVKNIVVEPGVTRIGVGAFSLLSNLQRVIVAPTVTEVAEAAFADSSLTSIVFQGGLRKLDSFCFMDCHSLASVTLPSTLKTVGESCFRRCKALTDVYYTGTEQQWKAIDFQYKGDCWDETPYKIIHVNHRLDTLDAFADVKESDWFYKNNAVSFVYASGLMNGDGAGRFMPNSTMTRAELVQIMYNHAGRPSTSGGALFGDVSDAKAWYYHAVQWAGKNGVVAGTGNGRFDPNGKLTREQLAVMIMRYVKASGETASLSHFPDAGSVSSWATAAVGWAVHNGVISGAVEGGVRYLRPRGNATRAEAATMLMNYFSKHS